MGNAIRFIAIVGCFCAYFAALLTTPAFADPWDDAVKDGKRFIPVELWTGSKWDGARDLAMKPADIYFGRNNRKRIIGPIAWQHPETGKPVQVYRRINRAKEQLFTVRAQKDGLGRVYDSRRSSGSCIDGIKFPLGWWREGETRLFKFQCFSPRGTRTREVKLTIERLDYTYDGNDHSLKFRWVLNGGKIPNSDVSYIYSPGHGLVDLEQN
jgi:hypothetical protein